MGARRGPPGESPAGSYPASHAQAERTSSAKAGAAAYPFDAGLRAENQRDLDLLRCINDRELAGYLYELYAVAERNSSMEDRAPQWRPGLRGPEIKPMAERALAGELGCDARELAAYLLLDETGRERMDELTLRSFARAFAKLRRG